ncbi:uncharacterized protein LOC123446281 [Hordeum vulgare subsp. vulgare]|uniref:uncharacterized protein LOC123446281 n=1 Tax=Hordeum vulgare subsp. vulgare TaxID=112509 RepID=UPI000B4830F5|nr:uncharacterized protein LOC123446281 [Hordeum vulgare subsp. vulgare]
MEIIDLCSDSGGTSLDAVAAAIQALEEKFKLIRANDDAIVLDALSFSTPKIRLLHSLTVEKKNSVQILVEVTTYANGSLDGACMSFVQEDYFGSTSTSFITEF